MLRPYTTDLPARLDLEFRTNSDKRFGVAWNRTDGTGIPITSVTVTFEFDVKPPAGIDDPPPVPVRLVIDSYDPADPDGYVDPDRIVDGVVIVTVRHGAFDSIVERSGNYDLQAVSTTEGLTEVLSRGIFTVTEGIS
jgi:hypothetical protein